MVHRKGDANHGAVNPHPPEDGFSEPVERLRGNPTHQDRIVSPAIALVIGKDEGTSPAATKSLDTS